MNRQRLEQLADEWRRRLVLREVLFALAAANLVVAAAIWTPALFQWQVPLLMLIGTLAVLLAGSRPWRVDARQLGRHLDRTCPELEESVALYLCPAGELTLLERMQLQRVDRALAEPSNDRPGTPPHGFLTKATLCAAACGLLAAVSGFVRVGGPSFHAIPVAKDHPAMFRATPDQPAPPAPPRIVGNVCTITPPAYTGHPPRRVEGPSIEAEEGSRVTWDLALDQSVNDARLVAGSVEVPLTSSPSNHLQGSAVVREPGLFSLVGKLPNGSVWNPPELFALRIIKDRPPAVHLVQPAASRTEIVPPAPGAVPVEAVVSDDYAVADAYLVATVAKGSGEAVKFREQHLTFDSDQPVDDPAARRFSRGIDFAALGMEPGDELYFYVEARDNRQPEANRARSETRFLMLRGPNEKPTTTGRGVAGINLIPQYFRSERQIILDTERLLADHPALSDGEFRTRANDLGQDQAFLRLRYGRFLGEDQEESPLTDHLETGQDPLQARVPQQPAGPRAAASIAARFAQEHVAQDREGGEDNSPRAASGGIPLNSGQIRQPFVDSHDLRDKNTFFDHGTQGTMRDAIAAMWEAEKELRTARPQEALPSEHRALDIIKDLQQSARSYVQHVGFDAPPIKVAERRLQGDITSVPARVALPGFAPIAGPAEADLRAALHLLTREKPLPPETLAGLEPVLTAAATRQPEEFLPGLQVLRRLRAGDSNPGEQLATLPRALLRLLPPAHPLPERTGEAAPRLADRYFEALNVKETQP